MNPNDPHSLPPLPSLADLRGQQSVRVTFKLSARAIEALNIVALHLGIRQKSLFDHLLEDYQTLHSIARSYDPNGFKTILRTQKTFVLSRHSLDALEQTAKESATPRDAIVEYSLQRLEAMISAERQKHRVRKKLLKEFAATIQRSEKLVLGARELLGQGDPFCQGLESALLANARAFHELEEFVRKGEVIESF